MRKVSDFRHRQVRLLGTVLTTVLVVICAQGQGIGQKVFDIVPEPVRARLIERLELYVEYQRTKQYERLYDLFSRTTIERIFNGQSRGEFVDAFRKGDADRTSVTIMEFTPTRIEETTKDGAELYNIYGDAKLCQQGEPVEKHIVVAAQLQNGDWYFSTLADVLDD